jgi:uncharacterized membrane protein YhaH (DUF805 family)
MDYFIGALKKYADFTGRARRKEYWMFFLFYIIFYFGVVIIETLLDMGMFSIMFSLAMLIPSISIAARRLHDTGRSGWWQLIALIPIIGLIVLIVFLALDGHDANDYGVNPKSSVTA